MCIYMCMATSAPAPERASQRFVMMVAPSERHKWGERAKNAGMTTAEFVRRAAEAFDPEEAAAMAELEALLPEFNENIDAIRASMAAMQARIDWALDPRRDEEARAKARASITDAEIEAMAMLLA